MTTIATALEASGELDGEAARELDRELVDIEGRLDGVDGSTARDIRSMVLVVRGTLYQKGDKLSDAEVASKHNAYTYANHKYWDEYYNKLSDGELYDWYGTWDSPIQEEGVAQSDAAGTILGDLLRPHLSAESKILMFGCGNSDMSEKMYRAGFENIVNVDISEHLLDSLRSRLQPEMPKMSWLLMNASDLTFDDHTFDVTLDKGTLDALEQNKPLVQAAAKEAFRTLRPGGVFLSVTFNSANLRVEEQLRSAAEWASCQSRSFNRPLSQTVKQKMGTEKASNYYVHACVRPP